ncbi:MAG: hypothetical protein ACRDWN_04560 [Acidimicrobiales bacterium]
MRRARHDPVDGARAQGQPTATPGTWSGAAAAWAAGGPTPSLVVESEVDDGRSSAHDA